MRYLIGALCAVAILFAAPADVAVAASVECGRVTTYVPPAAAVGGYVILAKPDGTQAKVILRAGTQIGALSGYVCLGVDSIYLTGLLAPGMAGYVPEPPDAVTSNTVVYCGSVAANSITSGQGSGPRTFELRVTSGPGGGGRFSIAEGDPLPTIGSYLCGRFVQGVPSNGLVAVLRAGDPGYVASGLPNTSTSLPTDSSLPLLGALGAALLAVLALLGLRTGRMSRLGGRVAK